VKGLQHPMAVAMINSGDLIVQRGAALSAEGATANAVFTFPCDLIEPTHWRVFDMNPPGRSAGLRVRRWPDRDEIGFGRRQPKVRSVYLSLRNEDLRSPARV
jgi:hypothetical protein